ncbi:MAG: metal-dependent hydrolase [Caldilineaceae bacterium]|nr:metal-dependent hydrolase [Caldilineaceae bacterium]
MIFAHLPASYITTNGSKRLWNRGLSATEERIVYTVGIGAGVLPDVDVIFTSLATHRNAMTHTPIFWLISAALLISAGLAFRRKRPLLIALALALLIGTFTHLITDAIFVGVKMLFPFSDTYFRMRPPIRLIVEDRRLNYLLNPIFLTEIYTFLLAWIIWREKRASSPSIPTTERIRRHRGVLSIVALITLAYCIHWFWLCPALYCPIGL